MALSLPRDNGPLLGKHLKLARKLQNLKEQQRFKLAADEPSGAGQEVEIQNRQQKQGYDVLTARSPHFDTYLVSEGKSESFNLSVSYQSISLNFT